jgi:hypothetical protein
MLPTAAPVVVGQATSLPVRPGAYDEGKTRLASVVERPHNPSVAEDVVTKEELRALVEARKELDADMEPALIDAFAERVERRIADRAGQGDLALKRKRDHQKEMTLGSMAISIPLLAIAAIFTGLPGVIAVCAALVLIAIVSAR